MSRHRPAPHKEAHWPLDFWVPDEGWVASSCITAGQRQRSIEHADECGDQDDPVSRWQGGLAGALSVDMGALFLFPPGPGDRPTLVAEFTTELIEMGLVLPTHRFEGGQRLKVSTKRAGVRVIRPSDGPPNG